MSGILKEWIEAANYIVFFGGAGTSTESAIPDFRSETGLYSSPHGAYPPEVMLSHSFFMRHTEAFYDFYRDKMIYREAKPNKAHIALARLESEGRLKAVITQNIDGLHQKGGSRKVLELHGSIHRNYCMDCGRAHSLDHVADKRMPVPLCDACGGVVRPDVVLYEEGLDMGVFQEAADHIEKADLLIVGGTSLVVYPAAGLVDRLGRGRLALINKQSTAYDGKADLVIHGSIGKTLEEAVLKR